MDKFDIRTVATTDGWVIPYIARTSGRGSHGTVFLMPPFGEFWDQADRVTGANWREQIVLPDFSLVVAPDQAMEVFERMNVGLTWVLYALRKCGLVDPSIRDLEGGVWSAAGTLVFLQEELGQDKGYFLAEMAPWSSPSELKMAFSFDFIADDQIDHTDAELEQELNRVIAALNRAMPTGIVYPSPPR
jgi:hypothetical protein